MRKFILPLLLLSSLMVLNSCGESYPNAPEKKQNTKEKNAEAKTVSKTNDMNVYVHFMPWFETDKTNNGKWPFHWTMNTRDPNVVDVTGKRQIASHYYPLTGPYASGDAAILDYQCLLMKYCGADGVMVDWYGINSDNDIAKHKSNTEALAKAIAKAGLKMAIVYEDSPLADVSDKVSQARQDVRYLAETFFHKDFYVKVEGRPLLMIFGPQQLLTGKDWYRVFSVLKTKPMFLCLNGHSGRANGDGYTNADGEFSWVNPTPDYSVASKFKMYIAGAMPGFKDYYKEGGAGNGYTSYDAENGALFQRQLDAAKKSGLKWLQISTWNDYGEGTTIEPTLEYGYKYLTMLQKFMGVSYTQADLELIYRWYQLRVAEPNSPRTQQAYDALVRLDVAKAKEILK